MLVSDPRHTTYATSLSDPQSDALTKLRYSPWEKKRSAISYQLSAFSDRQLTADG